MTKALTRRIGVALLTLCFLLALSGAQAQFVARWASENSNKIGLSPDQKTKIKTLQNDVENHYRAITYNTELSRSERVAKLRSLNESERSQLNEILTPAQQRKLKDLMYPKQQWRVSAYITPGSDLTHYTVNLQSHPSEYLSYTILKQGINLYALDANGKPTSNGLHFTVAPNVPDIIIPTVDENGLNACSLEFTLERKNAKPGFYTLQFTATIDAQDAETHEQLKIQNAAGSLRVYITPQPDAGPALRPGQRFIGTPWDQISASTVTPYRDVKSGKSIAWSEIATRIATLQRVEPVESGHRLTFVLEKHTGQIFLETEHGATDLPYLTPLLIEPTVKALKSEYEGKLIWSYGGPGVQCTTSIPGLAMSMGGRLDVPLRIRRVERVYLPHLELGIGNATFIGGERKSAFVTDNPLVVILNAPDKGIEFRAFYYEGSSDLEEDIVANPASYCLGLWNMASDRWDFERQYCLVNPFKSNPMWSAKMRKAVLNGDVIKGMTNEMVAWAIGWPSIYGMKSDLLALDDWAYDNIPFQGHVYFSNGRMVRQEWPSLP